VEGILPAGLPNKAGIGLIKPSCPYGEKFSTWRKRGWTGCYQRGDTQLDHGHGHSIGEDFDINKARYHKLFIMTDATWMGLISDSTLTFFYRYMKDLLKEAILYRPTPLYALKRVKRYTISLMSPI